MTPSPGEACMRPSAAAGRLLAACVAALAAVTPALAQDPNLGRNLAATCANCHGTNGHARGDMRPLAGMNEKKMLATMADFRNGNMPATIMHQIAKGYTDEQLERIAAYFAAQKPAAR